MERVPHSINERGVFVDTSAFLALVARNDPHHSAAKAILDRLEQWRYRLFTINYIVVETHASILRAVSPQVGRGFLQNGLSVVTLLSTRSEDEERGKSLILGQTDKKYSYCDAISFAVMGRYLLSLAFAFDDHFRQHGFSTPLDRLNWP